jgi:microcystin-dependent protein
MRLDSAMFLTGAAESGNLVTYDGMNWIARDIRIAATGNNQPVSIVQPYLAVNYCMALQGIYPSRNWDPFVGTIGIFGFNFAPRGWAQCNGQLLSIAQYSALFSLIGTYYGGDGRTTFALPDLRGRVPVNYGQGPGLSSYQIGQRGGAEQVSITIPNLPAHSHTIIFE